MMTFAGHDAGPRGTALAQERLYLEDEIRLEMNFAQIIGASPTLRKVLEHVETVAHYGFDRADLWRNRYREGTDRAGDS